MGHIPNMPVFDKTNQLTLEGTFPKVGDTVNEFVQPLITQGLEAKFLRDYAGVKVLNIYPSIDTGVCALSTKRFNKVAESKPDVHVLCISVDLPFAHGRFCTAEKTTSVTTLSAWKSTDTLKKLGVYVKGGVLEHLATRAVIVLDKDNKVIYSELVEEVTNEPNYAAAEALL